MSRSATPVSDAPASSGATDATDATDAAQQRRTRARYGMLVMIFTVTAINYLDRTNMSVALPHITKDLRLNATQAGLILSAFSWIYTVLQVPGGWLVDKIGSKLSYGVAMVGWSLVTMATVAARSFGALIGFRLALGVMETPAFPANNRLVANWFPERERGKATAVYTAGEYVGLALAVPLLSLIIAHYGWGAVFVCTGAVSLGFSVLWFLRLRNSPAESGKANTAEIAYIHADRTEAEAAAARPERAPIGEGLRVLFTDRRLWGLYVGGFANTSVLYFFLTWFPSYLVQAKHMSTIKAGFWGSVPYLAALAGVLIAGQGSDWLLRRGVDRTWARKGPVMLGLLMAPVIICANYTDSAPIVITFMSIAFFAQGLMQNGWAILSDIAPLRFMGLAGGVFSGVNNVGGALAPLVIGVLIDSTGGFSAGLVYIGALAAAGFLAYLFLLTSTDRIRA